MILIPSLLLFVTFAVQSSGATNVCLHEGCDLSGGLRLRNLNSTLLAANANDEVNGDVIKVLQWNILYDLKDIGEDNWAYRKHDVCTYINGIKPEVIGLQEVMESQFKDLKSCLLDYIAIGEPRDKNTNPLYNPIFVKKSERTRTVQNGTFWLSYTPHQRNSKTSASKEPRICSWVELRIRTKNGEWQPVVMATTHLAYRSMGTATTQINLLMTYLKEHVLKGAWKPIIVTGDFNWSSESTVYEEMENFDMHNTMAEAEWVFSELTALPPWANLVDYVWQRGFESLLSATMVDTRPSGRMLSDHRPVLAALKLFS